jgi:hypothetical protein
MCHAHIQVLAVIKMKSILLILSFLTFSSVYGQTGLTSYSADLPMKDSLEVYLVEIEKSDYVFYFRLLLSGQAVEIYSRDNQNYEGRIINSVKEYNQIKIDDDYRTQATKLYTEKVSIDSSKATSLAQKIIESGQILIPTDTLIDTWTRWYLHCGSLNFEIKNDGKYFEQSFHCPWSQPDSVEFKDVILSNYDLLKQELKLDSIYQGFWSQLPKGKTYSRSGYGMTYIMTDEQEAAWNKDRPRRDYLKSIKDTVDNYIKTKLREIQSTTDSTESPCYSASLTFDTKGMLKKIETSKYDRMKLSDGLSWYIEDIIENRKCKKSIKRIFRTINLSSFNLEYNVYRTFYNFSGNEWTIVDDTIY